VRRRPLPPHLFRSWVLALALTTLAPVVGCNGDGCPCCDLPRAVHDWIVEIHSAPMPDPITDYPIFIEVGVEVRSLENGTPAPDGLRVTLTVSPGAFVDGGSEIQRTLVDSGTSATIQADGPGSYQLAVTVEDAGRTAWITINVGT
jgi:hypothetical protein